MGSDDGENELIEDELDQLVSLYYDDSATTGDEVKRMKQQLEENEVRQCSIQKREFEQKQSEKTADDALESMIAIGTVEIVDNWVFYPSSVSLDVYKAINRMCDRLEKTPSVRFATTEKCVLCGKNETDQYSCDEVSEVCYPCYVDTINAVNKANATASKEDQQSPIEQLRRAVAHTKADDARAAASRASGAPITRDMLKDPILCVVCASDVTGNHGNPFVGLECHQEHERVQKELAELRLRDARQSEALRSVRETAIEMILDNLPHNGPDREAEIAKMPEDVRLIVIQAVNGRDKSTSRKTLEALAKVDEDRENARRVFWENLYQSPVISSVCVIVATCVILYYVIRSDM